MKFSAIFNVIVDLFDSKGNALVNDDIEFLILRANHSITRTKEKSITLPPARYTINAYLDDELIGVKSVELTNDKHVKTAGGGATIGVWGRYPSAVQILIAESVNSTLICGYIFQYIPMVFEFHYH